MSVNILETIVAYKKLEVAQQKQQKGARTF